MTLSTSSGGFSEHDGTFGLYDTSLSVAGAFINKGRFGLGGTSALTVTGGFANSGTLDLDTGNGDGGGSLTINGTLANTGTAQFGPTSLNLSAATTLMLGGLTNATGAVFQVYGSAAHPMTLSTSSGGFSENDGTFGLYDTSLSVTGAFINKGSFGLGGTSALTVTGGFANSGTLDLDTGNGDGGGSLTINGTLANTGTAQFGPTSLNLSAATTLMLGGLTNATGAVFQVYGSAAHPMTLSISSGGVSENDGTFGLYDTSLSVTGAFINKGSFGLGGTSALTVTGGFANSGTLDLDTGNGDGGGSLTINGTLANTGTAQFGPTSLN